jgi:phosphate/sulfate permease
MKTFQLFVVSAFILAGILFGVSSWFGLSLSATEWIVSDIIIGAGLYLGYLVAAVSSPYKIRAGYSLNKGTA